MTSVLLYFKKKWRGIIATAINQKLGSGNFFAGYPSISTKKTKLNGC